MSSFQEQLASAAAAANAGAGATGDHGALPVAGGVGGGLFPGVGAGLGHSFSFDAGLGSGLGGLFGGLPFASGVGGVPYVPVTPLGGLAGFKGDLLLPIAVVGVAIFLIVVILLAIKAALAWKMSLLAAKKGGKGGFFRREADETPEPMGAQQPEENQLNELAHMVLTAIQSQTCAQKVVCDIGTYARKRDGLANLLRILESMVPSSMSEPLTILRSSAEGQFDCAEKYPCGNSDNNNQDDQKKKDSKSKPNASNVSPNNATTHKVLTEPMPQVNSNKLF